MLVGDARISSEHIWCEVLAGARRGGPALFLDRDGVVVEETGYLRRVEDIMLIPGAAEVIAAANRRQIAVVLVTNQAGIGRGYYGWDEFAAVQSAILAAWRAEGAFVDAVYACPHHPLGQGIYGHPNHPARKPQPGMLLRAAADLSLDLSRSWLVGDTAADIEAAQRAGLAGALHVLTGHGAAQRTSIAALVEPGFEIHFGHSAAHAMTLPLLAA